MQTAPANMHVLASHPTPRNKRHFFANLKVAALSKHRLFSNRNYTERSVHESCQPASLAVTFNLLPVANVLVKQITFEANNNFADPTSR